MKSPRTRKPKAAQRKVPGDKRTNGLTDSPRDGLLLLNKKTGITSFDSLREVKKTYATGKVGHTGTLDKFASGLLLVLIGRGVKLAPLFGDCVKEYTGTIHFGEETDTLDPEGSVIAEAPVPSLDALLAILPRFRGEILQAPPAYSALHINGRRAHELVREGTEPEMKKRPITVHELEILSFSPPEAVIKARVSAGTYIRSLARDIALAAGSRAFLSALTRTAVGGFALKDAPSFLPLDRKLFERLSLPCYTIDDSLAKDFCHGKPLDAITKSFKLSGKTYAGVLKNSDPDEILGILEFKNNKWRYSHVFARP